MGLPTPKLEGELLAKVTKIEDELRHLVVMEIVDKLLHQIPIEDELPPLTARRSETSGITVSPNTTNDDRKRPLASLKRTGIDLTPADPASSSFSNPSQDSPLPSSSKSLASPQ